MTDPHELLLEAAALISDWEAGFPPVAPHPALEPDPDRLRTAFAEFGERLRGSYPFFHPDYAGQMLKPPHPVAAAGYLAAMLINPNNHALDGGPATSELEREVVDDLAVMFALSEPWLGHLTSSGTIANLEALWVARELHPGSGIAYGANAHYTHGRMCEVLGMAGVPVAAEPSGRIDLDALDAACGRGAVGTVVLTAGTTGLGAIDRIEDALVLRERHGVRIHVDAAYGGFFTLLARGDDPLVAAEPFAAIAQADSIVVDPHKHGLQPYGCGAVLFADPGVGRLYRHDSPYTYFTSDELHLGEISLECSRAGAAAAALWLTIRALPLERDDGLGPILAAGVRAARTLAGELRAGGALTPVVEPELDIVTYVAAGDPPRVSEIDAATERLLDHAAREGIHLSTLRIDVGDLAALLPGLDADAGAARVLMKPEHETAAPDLARRLTALV
jgi:glutamate/tyrosine decarboxylase-like PLP-dependent enzyme